MFKLSDASGTLTFTKIASGKLSAKSLDPIDVFIVDNGIHVFVLVAHKAEKKECMIRAENYLEKEGRPAGTPVSRVIDHPEKAEDGSEEFEDCFK